MRRWLCAAVLLSACGSSNAVPPAVAALAARDWVSVPFPPPPSRPEMVPPAPEAGAVWIDGEWRWRTGRWYWIYGRWVHPPDDAAGFARFAVQRGEDGTLYYASGVWVSTEGERLGEQPALELAAAAEGDVIEDVGIVEDVGPNRRPGARDRAPAIAPCDMRCRFTDPTRDDADARGRK